MRDLKFRAWDNKNKIMIDSSFGNWISFDGIAYEEANRKFDTPNIEIERVKDLTLMQFTGLKDKLGKEIYEGDIIETDNTSFFKIIWNQDVMGFEMSIKNCGDRAWFHVMEGHGGIHTWTVMGNIYQNPELLGNG